MQTRQLFDLACIYYLAFISFHALYALIDLNFVAPSIYMDTAAPFGLAYGPFLFIAVRSLSNIRFNVYKVLLHFTPFIAFTLAYIILMLNPSLRKNYISAVHLLLYSSIVLSMLTYSFHYIFRGPIEIQNSEVKKLLKFCGFSLIILAFMFTSIVSSQIIPKNEINITLPSFIVYFSMLVSVAFVFNYTLTNLLPKNETTEEEKEEIIMEKMADSSTKYFKSSVKSEDFPLYKQKLDELFDTEHVYLQNELNLDTLAKKLKISRHYLTQLFNIHIGENFNQYINRYRIEHAKQLLLKNSEETLTIEEIGFRSGFNSKVSFNRHFKASTGYTPTEFVANS